MNKDLIFFLYNKSSIYLSIWLLFSPSIASCNTDKTIPDESVTYSSLHDTIPWVILCLILIIIPAFLVYITHLRNQLKNRQSTLNNIETEWSYALDFLDDPIYMVDLDDHLLRANKAFYRKVGTTPEEATGKPVTLFTHPEGEDSPCKVCKARNKLVETTITLEADDPVNKSNVPTEISIKVIRDNNKKPVAIIQGMRDLTLSRATENAIRKSESLFRGILNATPDPLIAINTQGVITIVNSQFEKQFGYSRDEIIGQEVEVLIPEAQRQVHKQLRKDYTKNPILRPMGINLELSGLHKDGTVIPLEISLSPVTVDDELLIISTLHDISKRKRSEQELKRLASFPTYSPMPIVEINPQGEVTYVNPIAAERFPRLINGSYQDAMLENVNDLLKQLSDSENNTVIREFEIDDVIFEQNISYDKELERIRIYSWDITKIREMSQYMAYQANHDPLTGLVNRREFEKQLENAIASAVKENKHHVICYMDLDQFKVVNDTCGHIAGDALLQQLSATLQTHIRDSDLLARLGGDEFGLLLSGCETEFAENIAEKIRQLIQDFRFHWEEKTFRVGVSIGLVPIDAQSISVSDILSVADSACYLAKDHGRNQVYTYKPSDRVLVKHTDEMNWTHRVHEALENSRFILYSQQVVPVTNNKPGYQEILVRMIDSNDNIIPPTAFLPSAERYGQITDIDIWVITNALEHFSTVDQESCFALNLSGKTLGNSRSMRQIIDEINNCGIDPERICFEITETAMIANLNAAIRFVSTLRGQGCRIALDDFGSGLSSFAYLKNLPVDYLKIDGNFIRNMDSDPVNAAMVESIIQVGHKMNLEIIAEYVENKYILEHLKNMGINYVQGYAIAKPEPLSEITREPKSNTIV